MKKISIVIAAAALVAAALPSPAQARCYGCGAAIIGGVAAGAIIGSAIANSGPGYAGPVSIYEEGPPPPPGVYYNQAEGPVCHVENRQVWVPGYGWQPRRMEVCN
jgi:hypothetical protein